MINKIKLQVIVTKFIKYTLLSLVLLIVILVSYHIITNADQKIRQHNGAGNYTNNNTSKDDISLKINHPDLVGVSIEHGPYYIIADEMKDYSGSITFTNPVVRLTLHHIDCLNLKSKTAQLNISDDHLELLNDVRGNLNQEYYFEGEQAEIIKSSNLIKSHFPVKLFSQESNLTSAQGFTMNYQEQIIHFLGTIDMHIKQEREKFVTKINSDTLDVFLDKKIAHFVGHVVILRDGTKIEADKIIVNIDLKTDKIEKIFAYNNVKITDANNIATSEYGEYIVSTAILTMKEKVKLYKEENIIEGEVLHYNLNSKKVDLIGRNIKERVKTIIIPKQKKQ